MSIVKRLWVRDAGVWKQPVAVWCGQNDGTWKFIHQMYVTADGTPKLFLDQYEGDPNVPVSILRAAVNIEPHKTYWGYLIGGRKLGDINNSGTITPFDASLMDQYQRGIALTAPQEAWIEEQILPYIIQNPIPAV
jgi:hypothetical protein